jgi:acyl-CoA thioester hydrolase
LSAQGGWQNAAMPETTPTAPARAQPRGRDGFRVFRPITTRWADNDAYGHVNNVVY